MVDNVEDIQGKLLGNTLGREIVNLDLAIDISDEIFTHIKLIFRKNPVLIFRKQSLTPREYADFASRFGKIRPGVIEKYKHPVIRDISFLTNVNADGTVDEFGITRAAAWHYDGSFDEDPPFLAMLYGIEVPSHGGGTLFSDMYRAYETLPLDLKKNVNNLTTVNQFGLGPSGRDYFLGLKPDRWEKYGPIKRPLVMRHPWSGQPYLEFCMIHTAGFAEMTFGESEKLLRELEAHVSKEENIYYHKWQPGDIVIWDEHATMHKNAGDFSASERRIMLRAMIDENK